MASGGMVVRRAGPHGRERFREGVCGGWRSPLRVSEQAFRIGVPCGNPGEVAPDPERGSLEEPLTEGVYFGMF